MNHRRPPVNGRFKHLKAAYRSGLEATIAAALALAGVPVLYERLVIPYTQPEKLHKYHPDWVLPNGIIVESKGLFTAEDRQKMKWVHAQHPDLDIRMVFSNPNAKLYKGSKRTYAAWCEAEGFPYAHKLIPKAWLDAPRNAAKVAAVERLGLTL